MRGELVYLQYRVMQYRASVLSVFGWSWPVPSLLPSSTACSALGLTTAAVLPAHRCRRAPAGGGRHGAGRPRRGELETANAVAHSLI